MSQSSAVRACKVLLANPRLLYQGLVGRLRARLCRIAPDAAEVTLNGVTIPRCPPYASYTDNIWYGCRQVAIREVMRRYLSAGRVFIDVGANIGNLSAVGLGLVGPTGQVHAFEPVPRYYEVLAGVARANPGYQLRCHQCAAGAEAGRATITLAKHNIGLNTLAPDLVAADERAATCEVAVVRLDDYLAQEGLGRVGLIKIDTEGYEYRVLQGLTGLWRGGGRRPPIICEIMAVAYAGLGHTVAEFEAFMNDEGYQARSIIQPRRAVSLANMTEPTDVLFLPRD